MLERIIFSRPIKIGLSLLIVGIIAVLTWALLSGSGPDTGDAARPSGSGTTIPLSAQTADKSEGVESTDGVPTVQTIRQRSLR
jgi:hypothetical protein